MFYEDLLDKVCFELGYQSFESYKLIVEPPKPEDITPGYIIGIWTDLCYRAYDSNCHAAVMCIDALIYAALGIPISTPGDRMHPNRIVAYSYDYTTISNRFRLGEDLAVICIKDSAYETKWILSGARDEPFVSKYEKWLEAIKRKHAPTVGCNDFQSFLEYKVMHYKGLADPTKYCQPDYDPLWDLPPGFVLDRKFANIYQECAEPNKDRTSAGVVRFYLWNVFTGNLDASHKYMPERAFRGEHEISGFLNGKKQWSLVKHIELATDEERNQTEAEFKASLERDNSI